MRTRLSWLVFLIPFALAPAACDSPLVPDTRERFAAPDGAMERQAVVSLPFRATAYTDLASVVPDPACGAPPRFLNTQVGEGESTHLGHFSVTFTFCVDITDLLDDGQLTEGESTPYDNGVGVLVTANGDELYMTVEGVVLPSDDPDFDFQFQDTFFFTDGTGRFAGAEGQGMTDSYVTQSTNRTGHSWTGTLVLRPGQ